jgi:hypothetical protein
MLTVQAIGFKGCTTFKCNVGDTSSLPKRTDVITTKGGRDAESYSDPSIMCSKLQMPTPICSYRSSCEKSSFHSSQAGVSHLERSLELQHVTMNASAVKPKFTTAGQEACHVIKQTTAQQL